VQARDTSVGDAVGASPPASRIGSLSAAVSKGAPPLARGSSGTTASGE